MDPSAPDPTGPAPRRATGSQCFADAWLRRVGLLVALVVAGSLFFASGADAFIYWSNGNGSIGRAELDGTHVDLNFIPGVDASAVAVDGAHIYWANGFFIGRADLNGNPATVDPTFILANHSGDPVRELRVDGAHIYWITAFRGSAIARADIDGNPASIDTNFIPQGDGSVDALAIDGSHIYWNHHNNSDNTNSIWRATLAGGSIDQNFISSPNGSLSFGFGLAVDASHIYWTSIASIGRAGLDGSGAINSFITGANVPGEIAADGTHLYWPNAGPLPALNGTTIGGAILDASGNLTTVNESFITGLTPTLFSVAVDAGSSTPTHATSTSVSCSPTTVAVGQPTTCTATVTDTASSGQTTPSGTVSFSSDSSGSFGSDSSCTLSGSGASVSCQATYTTSAAGSGTHNLTATYGGDGKHTTSSGHASVSVLAGGAGDDGIPSALKQQLAEQFAPTLLFHPTEPNYPVSVDDFLHLSHPPSLDYYEECLHQAHGPVVNQTVAPGPLSQSDLLGHSRQGQACNVNVGFTPITSEQPNPVGGSLGNNANEAFYLSNVDNADRTGSLDPRRWITYYHAYPASNGGIMLQYWHFFDYNAWKGNIPNVDQHGGDWDASVQVELTPDLAGISGIWFSRHQDDNPGDEMHHIDPFSGVGSAFFGERDTAYVLNQTHPLVMVDSGGHAAFASPSDLCGYWSSHPGANLAGPGRQVWGNSPRSLHAVGCLGGVPLTSKNAVGGTVWDTTSNGRVQSVNAALALTGPRNGNMLTTQGGDMINLGEYNPGTMSNCNTCAGIPPGPASFMPLNDQKFIGYSGLWASPNAGDTAFPGYPPRGPVYQGYTDAGFASWFNQASSKAWVPPAFLGCGPAAPTPCPQNTPSPPQNLRAAVDNGSIKLLWDPPATSGAGPVSSYAIRLTPVDTGVALDPPNGSSASELTVDASQTSETVQGLTADCHQAYVATVAATNAAGQGEAARLPTIRPSGVVAGVPPGQTEPPLVVVLVDGINSSEADGFKVNPLHPGSDASLDNGYSYCPEDIHGHPTRFEPTGLQRFFSKWNFEGATPLSRTSPYQPTNRFMLDPLAGAGAVVLPFSYTGARLTGKGLKTRFSFTGYREKDTYNHRLADYADTLATEITDIHKAWPHSKVEVIGHSLGGAIGESLWESYIAGPGSHGHQLRGVVQHVFSLDSPISGVALADAIEPGVGSPTLRDLAARWSLSYTMGAQLGAQLSRLDQDLVFRPIGTRFDPTYSSNVSLLLGGDFDLNFPGTLSQFLLTDLTSCDASENCTLLPPDFASPPVCNVTDQDLSTPYTDFGGDTHNDATGIGHFVVKFCPPVVDYVRQVVVDGDLGGRPPPLPN